MSKLRVGVIYGSRSVEHEVSVITALQAMENLDPARYQPIPIYLTKKGQWLTGDALRRLETYKDPQALHGLPRATISPVPGEGVLRSSEKESGGFFRLGSRKSPTSVQIDVAFPCIHGTFGEDGTVQGLLELADIPYVGPGVASSALGMDKILMKAAFRAAGLPIANFAVVRRSEWDQTPEAVLDRIADEIGHPAFVKPANLGSSVGISRATDRESLRQAFNVASQYDRRLVVERGVEGAIDVNCSVLGGDILRSSVCEQPLPWKTFLSYDDKYMRGGKAQGMKGASRRIPAPISDALTTQIRDLAQTAFRAIDAAGVARIDFLVTPDEKVFVNEINTIPGSLSFYLWEATDLPFPKLLDELIELAIRRHADRANTIYSFDSQLLTKALQNSGKLARR